MVHRCFVVRQKILAPPADGAEQLIIQPLNRSLEKKNLDGVLWFKLFALHKHFPPLAQCARKYGVLARNMCEAQLRRMKCWAEVGVLAQTRWRCAMARWLDAINVPDSPENLSFHSTKCIVLINDILSLLNWISKKYLSHILSAALLRGGKIIVKWSTKLTSV